VISGSSVLALRRRTDPTLDNAEPIVRFNRFFSTSALVAYTPDPREDHPGNAVISQPSSYVARLAPRFNNPTSIAYPVEGTQTNRGSRRTTLAAGNWC